MPGLNQQGPLGAGPMTGKQRGMCKRTEDFSLDAGGLGGGWRTKARNRALARTGTTGRARRRFALGEEAASATISQNTDKELVELRRMYQEAAATLDRIAGKIEALEKNLTGSE